MPYTRFLSADLPGQRGRQAKLWARVNRDGGIPGWLIAKIKEDEEKWKRIESATCYKWGEQSNEVKH